MFVGISWLKGLDVKLFLFKHYLGFQDNHQGVVEQIKLPYIKLDHCSAWAGIICSEQRWFSRERPFFNTWSCWSTQQSLATSCPLAESLEEVLLCELQQFNFGQIAM